MLEEFEEYELPETDYGDLDDGEAEFYEAAAAGLLSFKIKDGWFYIDAPGPNGYGVCGAVSDKLQLSAVDYLMDAFPDMEPKTAEAAFRATQAEQQTGRRTRKQKRNQK